MLRAEVGVRELKNDLSRWVARARGGDEIVVTDRGAPVARLVPAEGDARIETLVAAGLIEPAARPAQRLRTRRRVRLRGPGPSMADYVARLRR